MEVTYAPNFVRQYKALPVSLQTEVRDKTELFRDPEQHARLKVHKLKGRLKDRYSFSVNYKTRIVFCFLETPTTTAYLLAIGDHHVYDASL